MGATCSNSTRRCGAKRHLRQRPIMLAAITEALLQHHYLVLDAAPLTDQHRTRFQFAHRHDLKRSPSRCIGGYAPEQAPGNWFKPAQRSLLQAVGHGSNQQVAAETCRRLGRIKSPPVRLQLCDIERLQPAILSASFSRSRSDNDRLIDCPPPLQADTHMARLATQSQSPKVPGLRRRHGVRRNLRNLFLENDPSRENPNARQIAEKARNEGSRGFKSAPLKQQVWSFRFPRVKPGEYCRIPVGLSPSKGTVERTNADY